MGMRGGDEGRGWEGWGGGGGEEGGGRRGGAGGRRGEPGRGLSKLSIWPQKCFGLIYLNSACQLFRQTPSPKAEG